MEGRDGREVEVGDGEEEMFSGVVEECLRVG